MNEDKNDSPASLACQGFFYVVLSRSLSFFLLLAVFGAKKAVACAPAGLAVIQEIPDAREKGDVEIKQRIERMQLLCYYGSRGNAMVKLAQE